MRPVLLTLSVALPVAAHAAEPDVRLTWTSTTCSDTALSAEATGRSASVCGGKAPAAATLQYQPSRSAMGCEVWVHAWCGGTAPTPAYAPPGNVELPTLYLDKDFKGAAFALLPGEVDLRSVPVRDNEPGEGGSWSRKASSLKVPAGWTLRICAEPGGQGRCSEIDGDVADLGTQHVGNDKALWVSISQGPAAALFSCPRAYHDDNFGGDFLELCQDWPDLSGSPWDDKISSVLVPAGWTVRLCQHAGFKAPCADFDADQARIGGTAVGSDRTSSVQVVQQP